MAGEPKTPKQWANHWYEVAHQAMDARDALLRRVDALEAALRDDADEPWCGERCNSPERPCSCGNAAARERIKAALTPPTAEEK